MAGTLEEANEALFEMKNPQEILDLLAGCQELAIEMGNDLESRGPAGKAIVKILEEYCEFLYQMSLEVTDEGKCRKWVKKIRGHLRKLLQMLHQELPEEKIKVVFLPYKASMWDSLESIWRTAAEDEHCDVYVIPIPYYEKGPDGNPGKMHYEGENYPTYVPITSWEEYSIAEQRPDIIFIHNPYDNWNHVTMVHPDFYAKELKKYTDILVYVPYFVGFDGSVLEEFCVLPGTMYSDYVILESEKVRQFYIKEFKKFEVEQQCVGQFGNPEKKFLALGSPKVDRVLEMERKREQLFIPEEWKEVLSSQSGEKKVILYNTTVSWLLKHNEKALDKIEAVLHFFQEEPGLALLWRPHPLYLQTLRTMRPELCDRYQNIVENYKKQGWGIFDDTPDIERAIALSDAYYGDISSVVTLYQATGKPILIQNYEIEGETEA